jgi:hypothetical protein
MRKLAIIIFMFIGNMSFGQDKKEVKDFFWGESDKFKNVISVPDKWKNESAVIICKSDYYDCSFMNRKLWSRRKIKLQDAAAIKEFSEFSFKDKLKVSRNKAPKVFGAKVIKPNGKEIEVDIQKEIIQIDEESKVAIPNLEIGDIIDFYYFSKDSYTDESQAFNGVEETVGDVYPIMDMKITFNLNKHLFFNFASYNGAPQIATIDSEKSNGVVYELAVKDIEKSDYQRWFYPFVEMPCYRFQILLNVVFGRNYAGFTDDKSGSLKSKVTKEEVFNFYKKGYKPFGDIGQLEDYIKEHTFASEEEKIREIYNFSKYRYFTRFTEYAVASEAKLTDAPSINALSFISSEEYFIDFLMSYLNDFKISYDIILATSRYNGSIDDLLIGRNLKALIRVNTPTPIYYEYFTPFTNVDMFDYSLENSKAYVLKVSGMKKIVGIENTVLPSTSLKDNLSKVISNVSINDDFTAVKVNRESSLMGHFKEEEQSDKLRFFDYIHEDYKKYNEKSILDRMGEGSKKERLKKEYEALINKIKDKQKENFKKSTSDEFDSEIADHSLTIKNTGRLGIKTPFVYEEDFNIKNNLIKKAGSNYLIEIGKMITSQIEIDKKEKERKSNVYFGFPRTFENEIVFTIPEGYTVSGLEKLNKNVTNDTGGFTSNAVVEGNKLIIKTNKFYNNYYEPNSNWSKMILFLDAAYQFTQEKILLKKK